MVVRLSNGLDGSDENRLVCMFRHNLKFIAGGCSVWILQLEMREQRDTRQVQKMEWSSVVWHGIASLTLPDK